jgi:hypothetical protein
MKPKFVTFTGIDDRTDFKIIDALSKKYPLEWGVLLSERSFDARFPSLQIVSEFASSVKYAHCQKSAHLCGKLARETLILEKELDFLHCFDRVQINGHSVEKSKIDAFQKKYGVECIIQHRELEFPKTDDYKMLFDKSGGRGKLPVDIPQLVTDQLVGFSGGINTDTVLDYLSKIKGDGTFWIDMEAGVRTDGWLDLKLVEEVLSKIYD